MHYRPLGSTGLNVSALSLGTVELGVDYGIAAPGEFGRPDEREAMKLLQAAADAGINLFDTAPAYGSAEQLLGRALGHRHECIFATKVTITKGIDPALREAVHASVTQSLRSLQRDVLDVVQIHNATVDVIERGEVVDALDDERQRGNVRFLGASVYTEDEALAVIRSKRFHVLQIAFNVLDQRMAQRVIPEAARCGVGVLCRSALLKGVLSSKAQWLPSGLEKLKQAADRARIGLEGTWASLPQLAQRFCLSRPEIATVLVGARTQTELEQALAGEEEGPLADEVIARTAGVALEDEELLNPSKWPVA